VSDALQIALIASAGFAAGAINAVAGGGSLVSFPALLAAGYPPVAANVTNNVAVLPGYLGGSLAYRHELKGQGRRMYALGAVSACGALVGSALLLLSPDELFRRIVPFLILLSCALLAAQPLLSRATKHVDEKREEEHRSPWLWPLQFLTAVYGGYFGAGLGIMMLAILGIFLEDNLQNINALKGVLSLFIGLVSAVMFALLGPVVWSAAAVMAVTSLVGGQAGVALARRMSATLLRAVVVIFGVVLAVYLMK
jgi:uncharacterized membrane protein YfcA